MHAYLLALEIEPIEINKVYVALPLHCTVMPWFFTEKTPAEVLRVITPIVQSQAPLELVSGTEALFGHEQDVPVNQVANAHDLIALHKALLRVIEPLSADIQSQWIGEGYSPHVTRQRNGRFETGQQFVATKAYLAEAVSPDELHQKRIIAKVTLGK